ncbi:glycosyltransferase [Ligilactobacillus equi]|uniref:glycosyltransferase n=1 Tax=Ligilactobacillus equi TaxID=137357 RepID=UPI002ED2A57E
MANILHLSRTMGQGGAEKVIYQICKDDQSDRHFVASCGGFYVPLLTAQGVKHFEIPDTVVKSPANILRTLMTLRRVVKEEKIDIVHSHHRLGAVYGRLLQMQFRNLKHLYTAHNVFLDSQKMMAFALEKATIVACGKTVAQNLEEVYHIAPEKITVIHNSIEKPVVSGTVPQALLTAKASGRYLIGSIGRLTEQKGMDIFIRALQEVSQVHSEVLGVIVGDGEKRAELEKLVADLGLTQQVLFLGNQTVVPAILQELEFVVLASRFEGFPLTPLEVFASEKTLIVSDIPSNLEIVHAGVEGLSFRSEDSQDLAQKILTMMQVDREKMAVCGAKAYAQEFSYTKFILAYQAQYQKISGGKVK